MNVDFSKFTKEQNNLLNEYAKDEMKKLKRLCYFIWGNKGIPNCYHDDLYSDGQKVLLESVVTFNPDGKANFHSYLTNNLKNSFKDWFRDTFMRAKRNNLELDENGKIKKDEKGNPIIISNVSFDEPADDGIGLSEKIASDFNVEDDIENFSYIYLDDLLDDCSKEMREYVNNILSGLQKKILGLIINDYSKEKIMYKLQIDSATYSDSIAAITSNRNTRKLRKKLEEKGYVRRVQN